MGVIAMSVAMFMCLLTTFEPNRASLIKYDVNILPFEPTPPLYLKFPIIHATNVKSIRASAVAVPLNLDLENLFRTFEKYETFL
jgi:hypothetical protein